MEEVPSLITTVHGGPGREFERTIGEHVEHGGMSKL